MQKILIIIGAIFLLVGLTLPWLQRLGVGHLPGDFVLKSGHFTFYFPLATSIIVSILLSGLLRLLNK